MPGQAQQPQTTQPHKPAATTTQASSSRHPGSPATPPPASTSRPGLLTPPTSHVELHQPESADVGESLPSNPYGRQSRLDASPTTQLTHSTAPRRVAGRLSGGGAAKMRSGKTASPTSSRQAKDASGANDPGSSERRAVIEDAKHAPRTSRGRTSRSSSSSRSRTPSPILGAPFSAAGSTHLGREVSPPAPAEASRTEMGDVDPLGRLSMPVLGLGLGATKEELELLIYGGGGNSPDRPGTASKVDTDPEQDIEQMLGSLAQMGLDDDAKDSGATEREKELASMVRLLAQKCSDLAISRDRARAELNKNRVTALSVMSSTKNAQAHALATERSARDRLEGELEGWKSQARMLSMMLSRAEARGYGERHSNDALDSKKAANGALATGGRLPTMQSEDSLGGVHMGRTLSDAASVSSRPASARQLQGPFDLSSPVKGSPNAKMEPATPAGEEGRGRDRAKEGLTFATQIDARADGITGLGISTTSGADGCVDDSSASALLRERNKLATDKRHLKARLRDTEAQVVRLETELKALRPYLVGNGIKLAEADRVAVNGGKVTVEPSSQSTMASSAPIADGTVTAPVTPSRSGGRRDKSRKKRTVTMGDAETEHLMLAARRLREMRKGEDEAAAAALAATGHAATTADVHTAASKARAPNGSAISVLAPAVELTSPLSHASPVKRQASEGLENDQPLTGSPRSPHNKLGERPPKTPKSMASIPTTPRLAELARLGERSDLSRPQTEYREPSGIHHQRFESSASVSSFTGIDELLQAAETLNPGPASASPRARVFPEHEPPHHFMPSDSRGGRYARELAHPHPSHALQPIHTRPVTEYDPYGYPPYHAASSPIRLPHESPKRRRVSSAAIDAVPYGSPFISDRQPRGRTITEGGDPFGPVPAHIYADYGHSGPSSAGASQALSALDLLADQAAASLDPSMGSDRSNGYDGVSPLGSLSSDDDAMADEGGASSRSKRSKGGDASKARSSKSPARSKAKGSNGATSANDASQSSSKSNAEARSFGGNQNPEKRLPYVRWSNEEDTKLRAAIKEHGQRWELISRAVGTRSYHQCRQRYLLMRRKEAAAKAQAEADEAANTASASASDQQSQEEGEYGRGPPASASVSRKKSSSRRSRGVRSTNEDNDGGVSDDDPDAGDKTATPLHKLSIGAPPAGDSAASYGPYSPTPRHGPLGPSTHGPSHSRSLSHPHGSSNVLPPVQPTSPYSSHHSPTPSARRAYYPASSPLIPGSRQLPPLTHTAGGPPVNSYGPSSSPTGRHAHIPSSPLHHHRTFMDGPGARGGPGMGPTDPTQTTPTNSQTTARRMGAALYS